MKKQEYYNNLVQSGILEDNNINKNKILNIGKNNLNVLKYYQDLRDAGRLTDTQYNSLEKKYHLLNSQRINNIQQLQQQQLQQQQQFQQHPLQQQQFQQQSLEQTQQINKTKNTIINKDKDKNKPIEIPQKNSLININNYFSKIYILNLERRKDRLDILKIRLNKNSITNYEIVNAIDGNLPLIKNEFMSLVNNPKNKISSSGALAYLYNMKNIINDAKNKNYENILILDDDVVFHNNFNECFENKIKTLNNSNWKLLYLGASQLKNWDKVKIINNEYYLPCGSSDGSFAVGIHNSLYTELLGILTSNKLLPFDTGPLRYIQHKYMNECLVMYPNIIIADVRESDIQERPKDQKQHLIKFAQNCKWDLKNFDF
jgi:GR25 family glycosyltransferase involved in LPS biosynthesis